MRGGRVKETTALHSQGMNKRPPSRRGRRKGNAPGAYRIADFAAGRPIEEMLHSSAAGPAARLIPQPARPSPAGLESINPPIDA